MRAHERGSVRGVLSFTLYGIAVFGLLLGGLFASSVFPGAPVDPAPVDTTGQSLALWLAVTWIWPLAGCSALIGAMLRLGSAARPGAELGMHDRALLGRILRTTGASRRIASLVIGLAVVALAVNFGSTLYRVWETARHTSVSPDGAARLLVQDAMLCSPVLLLAILLAVFGLRFARDTDRH